MFKSSIRRKNNKEKNSRKSPSTESDSGCDSKSSSSKSSLEIEPTNTRRLSVFDCAQKMGKPENLHVPIFKRYSMDNSTEIKI